MSTTSKKVVSKKSRVLSDNRAVLPSFKEAEAAASKNPVDLRK